MISLFNRFEGEARAGAVRLVAVTAAALLVLTGTPDGASSPQEPALAGSQEMTEHRGFSFSSGTCELGREFCDVTVPRPWTAAETATVRAALDEIGASDLGRRVVERAQANGFRTVRRYARAARLAGEGRYEAQPMIVAAAHSDASRSFRSIDVTDRFFERGLARDHFSGDPGYLLTTEILAHELVHGVDLDQRYSKGAEFRRIARLGMTASQQQEADRVNGERVRLIAQGQHESEWRASRSFALVTLRGRLPSLHALEGYREAFAEFGAHLVLDPHARKQFEPRLIQYVSRAITAPQ